MFTTALGVVLFVKLIWAADPVVIVQAAIKNRADAKRWKIMVMV
ncbi:MAG: hypothetical protein ABI660_19430 [Polaromonas sp.]